MATPRSNSGETPSRFKGCSSISQYDVMGKLGEGTFGEVHKARSLRSGKIVALKKILMHNEKDGFPITALREIKLLKMLSHVNILSLEEMAVERSKGKEKKKAILYMVTPYMDHDLAGLLENPDVQFSEPQIKCYMLQLLEGLRYLHNSHILHRDMKAANLLISNKGILQIADFGLARHYDDAVPQAGRGGGEARREYTSLVVTRWYRPPELLLQLRRYTTAIDIWGVGCVFGEMFTRKPILAGTSDLNQIQQIFDLVGAPTEENMPGWSQLPGCEGTTSFEARPGNLSTRFREQGSSAISLLAELLKLDWRKRINAIDALKHPYFRTAPLPAKPNQLPTYDDSHELDRRKFRTQKAPPPAPAGGTVGMGPEGTAWAGPPGAFASGPPSRDTRAPGWAPDRDGSGPPRAGYDSRSRVPNYDRYHDNRRPPVSNTRPGWQPRDDGPPRSQAALPPTNGSRVPHPLPPNPITRSNVETTRPNVDTYIPSYMNGGDTQVRPLRDDRPPREDRAPREERGPPRDDRVPYEDRPPRDERRNSRDERDYRDRGDNRQYTDRDRDRDRDRRPYYDDRPPPHDNRGRPNGSYADRPDRDNRRTRSKSPLDRDRGERPRDRDARDRDLYRR